MTIQVWVQFVNGRNSFVIKCPPVPFTSLDLADLTSRIAETEGHLSRLTGMRVQIITPTDRETYGSEPVVQENE